MNTCTKMSRRARVAAVLAGVTGVVVLPAAGAWAEPAGCTSSVSGYTSSVGLLVADGSGTCAGDASRTLRVEIKQSIPLQSDPLLAASSDSHYGRNYAKRTTSCDHGKTAYYYGRAFFTQNSTYHDTDTTRQTTCF